MIGKVTRGRRVPWLLAYLYGPGRRNEHTNPHTIAGFDDPDWLDPPTRLDGRRATGRLAELLEQPVRVYRRSTPRPVWHCSVRAAPADRLLTDPEWAAAAEEVMHCTGLARRGDDGGCRWVAIRHADDHIHLVATLARQDGAPFGLHNDYYRVGEACAVAEYELGLTVAPRPDRSGVCRPRRAETERARREGHPRPAREVLRRRVQFAAARAGSVEEFIERLRQEGLLIRLRDSETAPGEITGYAVGLPGYHGLDGQPVWFGGGKLAADLSLPRLRRRWAEPAGPARALLAAQVRDAAEHALGVEGFADRLRQAGLRVRLRQSRLHPGQVSGYAVADPGGAAADRAPVWFAGSALGADLSLPRLLRRWAAPTQSVRVKLTAAVRAAAARSSDVEGFADMLRRDGLLVRLRSAPPNEGEAASYAVASPDHVGADGQPAWFAGSTLAADLALPQLRRRWLTTAIPRTRPGPTKAPRRAAAAERLDCIQVAARLAGEAAEQMRRTPVADDPAAAAAAHAAADVYRAAARVLDGRSGGALSDAADAFARAARERWGIVPARTPTAVGLRAAARALLVVGRLASNGEASAMQVLLLQLAATADALAALRRAQSRAAQSAAARRAAEAAATVHEARRARMLPAPVPTPVQRLSEPPPIHRGPHR